jgi:uncharacterized protein YoxC
MPVIDVQVLIFAQIAIDIAIVILFIFMIRRFRHNSRAKVFDKAVKILESLLTDADKLTQQFNDQLEEKHRLIKKLNAQLDSRINGLTMLLQRADTILSSPLQGVADSQGTLHSLNTQAQEIMGLANSGCRLEEIAERLSIPKEEVKLILDLREKLSRIGSTKGVS